MPFLYTCPVVNPEELVGIFFNVTPEDLKALFPKTKLELLKIESMLPDEPKNYKPLSPICTEAEPFAEEKNTNAPESLSL